MPKKVSSDFSYTLTLKYERNRIFHSCRGILILSDLSRQALLSGVMLLKELSVMRYAGIIFCFFNNFFFNIQLGSIIENLSVLLTCNLKIDATFVSENIFLCPMCLVSLVLLCK